MSSLTNTKNNWDGGFGMITNGDTGLPRLPCARFPHIARESGNRIGARGDLTVVLAEHRDEIFARLAADLHEAGYRVRRAKRGGEVWPACLKSEIGLVITHVWIPDESGWLIAAKLRLMLSDVPIWLYTPCDPPSGASLAEYVGVDQRIHYGGDLWRLSADIIGLLPAVGRTGNRDGSHSMVRPRQSLIRPGIGISSVGD